MRKGLSINLFLFLLALIESLIFSSIIPACFCIVSTLSGAKNDSTEDFNMEMLMAGNQAEILTKMYQNDAYRKSASSLLKFFDKRGYLDMLLTQGQ